MVRRDRGGSVVFSMYLPQARRVQLAASFTDWRAGALDLRPVKGGWWTVTLTPPPGEHEFHYIVDDARPLADFAADGIRMTPEGGWITSLLIPAGEAAGRSKAA